MKRSNSQWTMAMLQQKQKQGTISGFIDKGPVHKPASKKKASKYGNDIIYYDGEKFHSKHELKCWKNLLIRLKVGEIGQLRRQTRFDFIIDGKKIGHYTSDADYYIMATGEYVVEDAKSPATRKDTAYRLRRKMMIELHGITIREV